MARRLALVCGAVAAFVVLRLAYAGYSGTYNGTTYTGADLQNPAYDKVRCNIDKAVGFIKDLEAAGCEFIPGKKVGDTFRNDIFGTKNAGPPNNGGTRKICAETTATASSSATPGITKDDSGDSTKGGINILSHDIDTDPNTPGNQGNHNNHNQRVYASNLDGSFLVLASTLIHELCHLCDKVPESDTHHREQVAYCYEMSFWKCIKKELEKPNGGIMGGTAADRATLLNWIINTEIPYYEPKWNPPPPPPPSTPPPPPSTPGPTTPGGGGTTPGKRETTDPDTGYYLSVDEGTMLARTRPCVVTLDDVPLGKQIVLLSTPRVAGAYSDAAAVVYNQEVPIVLDDRWAPHSYQGIFTTEAPAGTYLRVTALLYADSTEVNMALPFLNFEKRVDIVDIPVYEPTLAENPSQTIRVTNTSGYLANIKEDFQFTLQNFTTMPVNFQLKLFRWSTTSGSYSILEDVETVHTNANQTRTAAVTPVGPDGTLLRFYKVEIRCVEPAAGVVNMDMYAISSDRTPNFDLQNVNDPEPPLQGIE
jgi:hypothetical protein